MGEEDIIVKKTDFFHIKSRHFLCDEALSITSFFSAHPPECTGDSRARISRVLKKCSGQAVMTKKEFSE
jgi:hypothetical protein